MAVLGGAAVLCAEVGSAQQVDRTQLRPPDAVAQVRFTHVISVRELSGGSLLVADRREQQLVLLQWDSAHARPIGRVGSGPGEYRGIGWLHPLSGDSTLFTDSYHGRWNLLEGAHIVGSLSEIRPLNRLLGGRLSGVDQYGHVLGIRTYSASHNILPTREAADSLLLLLGEWESQRVDTIARLRGRGSTTTAEPPQAGRPPAVLVGTPLDAEDEALLFPDGWIAVARLDPYRVEWRTPDGRWMGGAPLPWTAVRVDDREKCAALARWFRARRDCDPSRVSGWPETIPPFIAGRTPALLAAPDGSLVIARTPTAASPYHHFDIVDRRGRLAGVISLGLNATLIGFGARSVYVLVTDDVGLQTLQRHPWP